MLTNFTIIKLSFCLVIGIVIAHYFTLCFNLILFLTIGLAILVGLLWMLKKSKIDRLPFFGLLSYICVIGIGMLSYTIEDEKPRALHYTNLNPFENYNLIVFKIEERLKPDSYNDKYIVSISALNTEKASGRLLINVKKDSSTIDFNVDAVLSAHVKFQEIQKPLNPHQFDYGSYLALKQVHHQLYLNQKELELVSDATTSIYGYADELRTTINSKLIEAGFKNEALSIMNALLLGQRQSIDKSIYTNYVNSGTIHILAVSGLHVGLILWILNFIFRPLLYLKYGHFIRPLVLVLILWSYAVIAGLSPSVTRAVSMFSIISIAMHLRRQTNIYNTLAISAFAILLFKPTFLFEVGFQMSYLAVLGIVSVQPIIYKLWKPKYLLFDKLWQIFTVTLAAQAGVVPISLFYFHQFPGLFFLSNLVVIPFLGVILGFGLLIIALALLNMLHDFMVITYSFIIESLNDFIAWVAHFENFLLEDIPFSLLQVLCAYWIIFSLIQLYHHKTFKWVVISCVGVIGFQSVLMYHKSQTQQERFIVFNKSRYSIIAQHHKNRLVAHHNLDTTDSQSAHILKTYKVGEWIKEVQTDTLQSVYQHNTKRLLVIDSLGVYMGLSFKPQYLLLRNSPRFNLNRVIDSLQPELIIADASNYKSYVNRWKATCAHKKIPFHYTNEQGAFILD